MAQLTKQQQQDIFRQGKQLDPRDASAVEFVGDGFVELGQIHDEATRKQRAMFHQNGLDPRDTSAGVFMDQYEKLPEQVRKQREHFTGSIDPRDRTAIDFIGS